MTTSDTQKDWAGSSGRVKGRSTSGTLVFVLLRLLDLPLQYTLLSGLGSRLITRLNGSPTTYATTLLASSSSINPLHALLASSSPTFIGLSPYHTLILLLATGSAAKQIFWVASICNYEFPPGIACVVGAYNIVLNTINTLLALWIASSNNPSSGRATSLDVGLALYVVGLLTEWICEVQRKAFKAKPENKDKPYSDGLFGLATNINYGGYTLWRTGYAIVCAGLPWGIVMTAWSVGDFVARAVPGMDEYCQKRVSCASKRHERG